ncbi:LPXTG cell wall anchor domain-containing protein [Microbacterium sp. RURRCA19A]|uniref:LPXTG cell wall anchor domain-containing protein n=1 Tax=Microbacterium sp. RURRCA19A TaxID=1907391 RepID=UPI0020CA1768|nr:LPXTG cell wall anchor domain-containing protein [Microbacterium sp. RURRCA19A]
MLVLALVFATAVSPPPAAEVGSTPDSQVIVVEVPASARQTPTPSAAAPSPAPSAGPRSDLPATGWDAAASVAAVVLGVAALVAGILVRRRRRPAA